MCTVENAVKKLRKGARFAAIAARLWKMNREGFSLSHAQLVESVLGRSGHSHGSGSGRNIHRLL